MEKFRHPGDCHILRDNAANTAALIDADGDVIRVFVGDWTDAQIFESLSFANSAYVTGVAWGEKKKAKEIRRALGV